MNRSHSRFRMARLALAVALVLPVLLSSYGYSVASQAAGNSYTSPHYGYSITWQAPWYVTEDDTDEDDFDILGLADGQSNVFFSGARTNQGSPEAVVSDYADQMANASSMSNFRPLDAADCPVVAEANSAVGCYRADQQFDDGTQSGIEILLKGWDLGDGIYLLMEGYVDEGSLSTYLPRWQALGVYAPGQSVPQSANSCELTVEHGASYCFDPALPERDRNDVAEAVRYGQDSIQQYFGGPELDDLRINEFNSASSDGDTSLATTIDRSIVVYGGSDIWQMISPLERYETVVHELFHVYQNVHTESSSAVIPLWFTEGSAEAVGYQAVSQLGVTDQTEIYDLNLYSLSEFPTGPLSDLQTSDSMNADSYPLAYIAVQYLLGSKGMSISALGDVYTELQQGATFEDAFMTVFGEPLDQFYTEFEAWRPNLQKVVELPDDFWPIDGDTQPATIAVQSVPAQVAPDDQLLVVGKTNPLTDCHAVVPLAGETIQRQAFANGEGEVFWLITIPADATPGAVTITLSCDAAPVTATFSVT